MQIVVVTVITNTSLAVGGVTKSYFKETIINPNQIAYTFLTFKCIGTAHRERSKMAYTCVLAPSRECDGCQECEETKRGPDPWDEDYDRDDDYCRYLESEDRNYDC